MKLSHKTIKLSSLRYLYLLIIPVFIVQISPRVFGLSTAQQNLFNSGVYYFDAALTNCSAVSALQGSDNMQQAFNYFVTKGFTPAQSAGIVGNLIQESGVNPLRDQMNNGPGRGIAQWEYYPPPDRGRWNVLLDYAASRGDPRSLAIQLDFIMAEFNSNNYSSVMNDIKSSTTIEAATDFFMNGYEKPNKDNVDQYKANETSRVNNANGVLASYGGSTIGGSLSSNQGSCVTNCLPDTSTAVLNLSAVRTAVVCHAQEELTRWAVPSFDLEYYKNYSQNRIENWCADFASWIYDQAGYPLKPDPKWSTPGVYEVKQIGDQNQNFHYYDSTSYTPRPGDLAIHSKPDIDPKKDNPYYHVNIVVDVNPITKLVTLIGGNQGGTPGSDLGGATSVNTARVSRYTLTGYSTDNIIGYVSPD